MLHTYFTSLLRLGEKSALPIFAAGAVLYFISATIVGLINNYLSARKTGLRILISPITPYTLQWRLAASFFAPVLVRLAWYRALDWTCAWQDGSKLHDELGKSFVVVAPGLNVLCSSDPKTMEGVLRDWRGFVKPDNVNEILGTFGQNVDTSNGDDWPRHRKIVAPCFTERASASVWTEAVSQSNTLLSTWLDARSADVVHDTSALALNVISAVAFENQDVGMPKAGYKLSLLEALKTVMSTSISPALEGIMPYLSLPFLSLLMPPSIKKLMLACTEFRNYTTELLANHKASNENGTNLNLINTLIKANAADSKMRLEESELRGNVFIFTVGGLESTSATLAYALGLLATHPEIQDWVREEIDELIGDKELEEVEYRDVFPKLKRVLGVMFETLRLYSPSPPLPRSYASSSSPFSISSSKETIECPPGMQIMLNSWASHAALSLPSPTASLSSTSTSPQESREDNGESKESGEWNPKRWLSSSGTPSPNVQGFYPWGSGPRICPGMKFSQVEFCAVIVSVLSRVKLGADKDAVAGALGGSRAEPLLLGMRGGVRVGVEKR